MSDTTCPCGADTPLTRCCGRYVDTDVPAPTAEALMRSRYTAFTLGAADYLARTWHPDTRPTRVDADAGTRWLGLKVKRTEAGGDGDQRGLVEFVARFKVGGRAHRIHETSRFERLDGRWVYVSGDAERR